MPEDIAITSSKSDIDPCSRGRETDRQKSADGQTAFQLYIVDIYIYIYIKTHSSELRGQEEAAVHDK